MENPNMQSPDVENPDDTENPPAYPAVPAKHRGELSIIVPHIMKLKYSKNIEKLFNTYLTTQSLLGRIMIIESVLNVETDDRPRKEKIENFMDWYRGNGGVVNGAEIYMMENYEECGLRATKPLKYHEIFVRTPKFLTLCDDTCHNSEKMASSIDALKRSRISRLAFHLIYEKVSSFSSWGPYLDVLPTEYNNILYFDVDEMQEMRNSNNFVTALKMCISTAKHYALLYSIIHNEPSNCFDIWKKHFTWKMYR